MSTKLLSRHPVGTRHTPQAHRWPLTMFLSTALSYATIGTAGKFDNTVPLRDKGASTYYVPCNIEGYGRVEMLVDTGSAYTTINEQTLDVLIRRNQATYIKDIDVKLANGNHKKVPIYRINSISIGNACEIKDLEAAVLPGNTRGLLGLNALNKAGPIIFSMDPPRLTLSNCQQDSHQQ
ncbi:MAG: retropepsin-like aspartic protease [Pseudomonadota bacterium]